MGEDTKIDFTLADHDAIATAASGVAQLLNQFANLEKRVSELEKWKIRVMAIVLCIGAVLGYSVRLIEVLPKIYKQ